MENNIFTAEKYLSDRDVRPSDIKTSEQLGSLLVAYASACSASSIGEEEIKSDMVVKMILKHLAIMDEKLINIQSKLNNL